MAQPSPGSRRSPSIDYPILIACLSSYCFANPAGSWREDVFRRRAWNQASRSARSLAPACRVRHRVHLDDRERIGDGTHSRVVVNVERFDARIQRKLKGEA